MGFELEVGGKAVADDGLVLVEQAKLLLLLGEGLAIAHEQRDHQRIGRLAQLRDLAAEVGGAIGGKQALLHRAAHALHQLGEALAEALAGGIVHRDQVPGLGAGGLDIVLHHPGGQRVRGVDAEVVGRTRLGHQVVALRIGVDHQHVQAVEFGHQGQRMRAQGLPHQHRDTALLGQLGGRRHGRRRCAGMRLHHQLELAAQCATLGIEQVDAGARALLDQAGIGGEGPAVDGQQADLDGADALRQGGRRAQRNGGGGQGREREAATDSTGHGGVSWCAPAWPAVADGMPPEAGPHATAECLALAYRSPVNLIERPSLSIGGRPENTLAGRTAPAL